MAGEWAQQTKRFKVDQESKYHEIVG